MRRHTACLVAVAAVVAGACGDDDGATGTSTCRPEPVRAGELALEVDNLVEPSPDGSMDTDGDGRDDVVEVDRSGVTVRRAGGVLHLPGTELRTSADLDGDGRDDLLVRLGEVDVAVPGDTADGAHDALEVGVRLPPDLTYVWPDDLDGRPGADFAQPGGDRGRARTRVWSGAEVLALAPGGDAGGVGPARTLPGLTRAVVALDEGGEAETVLLVPGDDTMLRFADRPGVELRSGRSASRVEDVLVFDEDGERRIALVVDRWTAVWAAPPTCR